MCTLGLITPHEFRAAVAFREIYDRAYAGGLKAQDLETSRSGRPCGRLVTGIGERQMDALHRLHRVQSALGSMLVLLELSIVDEKPWSAIARKLRVDPRTARTWSIAAISALAAVT